MMPFIGSPRLASFFSPLIGTSRQIPARERGPCEETSHLSDAPCRRCGGLMVPSYTAALENDGTGRPMQLWRCVNCGEYLDPCILSNRTNGLVPTRQPMGPEAGPRHAGNQPQTQRGDKTSRESVSSSGMQRTRRWDMEKSPSDASDQLWSIVLAGGEGTRLSSLVHRWLGRPKPKQYCAFVGSRSMFQHTLDRAASLTAPDRTVTVVAHTHRQEALAQLEGRPGSTILFQPANRDTAAGVFLPLTYIRAKAPQATVVIYPSDHFVYPEGRFLDAVRRSLLIAESRPDRLVLLGIAPDRLELDYGWIQPGRFIAGPPGEPVQAVHSFLEKPDIAQADTALRAGALWNTLVFAVNADLLWTLGWQCIPDIMPFFERLSRAVGSPEEGRVLKAIYQDMPARNFSSDVLQRVPGHLAVVELSGVLWSDWGKPERIAETLRRIDRRPAFPLTCLDHPFVPFSMSAAEGGLPMTV